MIMHDLALLLSFPRLVFIKQVEFHQVSWVINSASSHAD